MAARKLSEVAGCFIGETIPKAPRDSEIRGEAGQGGNAVFIFGADVIDRSFLTCNLALDLCRLNHNVMVIDADPTLPTVEFLLGEGSICSEDEHRIVVCDKEVQFADCNVAGSRPIELCRGNGDSASMSLDLIDSIIEKCSGKKFVLVNAHTSIIETCGFHNNGLSQVVFAVGKTKTHNSDVTNIVKNLLEKIPSAQVGLVFLRYENPRQTRAPFLHIAGAARAVGLRPVVNLGMLPNKSELYSSILYRRPLMLLPETSMELKERLNRIAGGFLKTFCANGSSTDERSFKTG